MAEGFAAIPGEERAALLRRAAETAIAIAGAWAKERSLGGLLEPLAFATGAIALAASIERPRASLPPAFFRGMEGAIAGRVFPLDARESLWGGGLVVDAYVAGRGQAEALLATGAVEALEALAGIPDRSIDLTCARPSDVALQALAPLVEAGAVRLSEAPQDEDDGDAPPLPVLVAPGPWSRRDMDREAKKLASMVALSAAGVLGARRGVALVVERAWLQREGFVERVHAELDDLGATVDACDEATQKALAARFSGAERRGARGERAWVVCPDVSERDLADVRPPPGAVLQVTLDVHATRDAVRRELEGPRSFVPAASAIARSIGAPDACLLAHGSTLEAHGDVIARAASELGGDLGINTWPAMGRVVGARLVVAPRRVTRVLSRASLGSTRAAPWVVASAGAEALARRLLDALPEATWGEAAGLAVAGLRM